MTPHDISLLALRPIIPAVQVLQASQALALDSIEFLHHVSARPILKMNHARLIMLTAAHIKPYATTFLNMSAGQQCAFLSAGLKKEPALRMVIIGLVIGYFTEQETERYVRNSNERAELNKRIIEMALERVFSDLGALRAYVVADKFFNTNS